MSSTGDFLNPELMSRLDRLDLLSRKILGGKLRGERRARHRATQALAEPAGYRDYSTGDDPRFIDWNIYARLDKPFIKLFTDEQDLLVHILLDISASCDFGDPNKLIYLKQTAAALGYVALASGHWLSINTIWASSGLLRGRRQVRRMVEFLSDAQPAGLVSFAAACRQWANRRPHQGVCIVLSDFLIGSEFDEGMRYIEAGGHDVLCLGAISPQEMDPVIKGDARGVDIETERETNVTPATLEQYKLNLQAHLRAIADRVRRTGGVFESVSTDYPVDHLIFDCLRRAGVLY